MKMDVSKFKKISSDDKKTTFKHPNGHTIVVAHGPLGKKLKEGLDKLPMYADGGGVEDTDQDTSTDTGTPQGPVQIFVGGQPQPQQAQPQEIEQAPSNRQEQAQERADQTGTPPPAAPTAAAPAPPPVADQVLAKEANAKPSVPKSAAPQEEDDSPMLRRPILRRICLPVRRCREIILILRARRRWMTARRRAITKKAFTTTIKIMPSSSVTRTRPGSMTFLMVTSPEKRTRASSPKETRSGKSVCSWASPRAASGSRHA